jgi:exoribonuclease R
VVLHRLRSTPVADLDLDVIRAELEIPGEFPPDVLAAADQAARQPRRPERDATHLDLVTIDPPGSRDLDQAVAVDVRPSGGWRVHYAIADVAAWVVPDGPIDREARARTQTHYTPDRRVPLHPPVLGEQAASLLPDGPRPAVLWTIDVEPDGTTGAVEVQRALVRSRAQLTYAEVQADLDAGRAPAPVAALPELGAALLADARRRGAIDLGLPEQVVTRADDGSWDLTLRADLPVEHWNAQVSLLTGRAAARLMLDAGVGVLRTLPTPDPAQVPRLQRAAANLGIAWPDGAEPGAVLAALDTSRPRHAAFADLAAELLRGAAYTLVVAPGDVGPPGDAGHAGVGGPYAHVTAPLRRLVDRFATEVCLSVSAGEEVPPWVLAGLAELPERMADGDRRAKKLDRAVVDAAEALVLSTRVGQVFPAAVVETGERFGTVVLDDPAVRGRCDTRHLPLGAEIQVRCTEADVVARSVRFERVS